MERGELCNGQCMGLPLAECMQDIGAAKPDVEVRCTDIGLEPGVW